MGGEIFGITFQKGDVIFSEGELGNTMYVIQSGAVQIIRTIKGIKSVLAILETGDFFGEMALIDRRPRSATAIAISKTKLLPFTRETLIENIKIDPEIAIHLLKVLCFRINKTNRLLKKFYEYNKHLFNKNNISDENKANNSTQTNIEFTNLKNYLFSTLNTENNIEEYHKMEYIFHEGESGNDMYLILEGSVEISIEDENGKHVLANLTVGDFFGESAIITETPRNANAIAIMNTKLIRIKKEDFIHKIKQEPKIALYIIEGLILRLRTLLSFINNPQKMSFSVINFNPFIKRKTLIKTSIISLSTCGGCSATLIEKQDNLLNLLNNITISYCPMLLDEEEIKESDVALVDGLVRVKEDEEKLIEARQKSKYLIAWGTCSTFGGIPAQANIYELEDLLEESYGHTKDVFSYYFSGAGNLNILTYQKTEEEIKLLRRARKIDDYVKVDYYIPGCPPSVSILLNLIFEIKGNNNINKSASIVCAECKRKQKKIPVEYFWISPRNNWNIDECFTSHGSICLGFITRGGCGATCTKAGLPCWGCRGPSDQAFKKIENGYNFEELMVNSLISRNRNLEDQIKTASRIFIKHSNNSLKFNRYITNIISRIR